MHPVFYKAKRCGYPLDIESVLDGVTNKQFYSSLARTQARLRSYNMHPVFCKAKRGGLPFDFESAVCGVTSEQFYSSLARTKKDMGLTFDSNLAQMCKEHSGKPTPLDSALKVANHSFLPFFTRDKHLADVLNSMDPLTHTVIFTDGSCKQGHGGSAIFAMPAPERETMYATHSDTTINTNQRAELKALLMALELCKRLHNANSAGSYFIVSDSIYALRSTDTWHLGKDLENPGEWRTTKGGLVLNTDLIVPCIRLFSSVPVKLGHVKAHDVCLPNIIVDSLAQKEASRMINKSVSCR